MKKVLCLIIAVMMLAGCASSDVTTAEPVQKAHDGISYQIPGSWQDKSNEDSHYYYLPKSSTDFLFVQATPVSVNIYDTLDVAMALLGIADGIVGSAEDVEETLREMPYWKDLPSLVLEYTGKIKDVPVSVSARVILTGSEAYAFMFCVKDEFSDSMRENMSAILDSITLE